LAAGRIGRRGTSSTYAGHVLQLTRRYARLFAIAAGAYLIELFFMVCSRPD
jgi:hypothetical protein